MISITKNKFISKMVATAVATIFFSSLSVAQIDTGMSLLDPVPDVAYKVENTFKTTKVINLQSVEFLGAGVFDFKINHRFGALNSGAYNAFGLDQSTVRIGGEYGINKNLTVGMGRQGSDKTIDGFLKYRIMSQTSDNKKPFTAFLLGSAAYRNIRFDFDASKAQRMVYASQLSIGRKFSEVFSLQLTGSYIHFNMVKNNDYSNDLFSAGLGLRAKITPRTTFNFEYIPVFGLNGEFKNSMSVGFDIETGGHVFQLHFTNSSLMYEAGYLARTEGDWMKGGIRFGFNISRVFTIVDYNKISEPAQ